MEFDQAQYMKGVKARRRRIERMRAKGMTLADIARAHNISRQRVWQILRAPR